MTSYLYFECGCDFNITDGDKIEYNDEAGVGYFRPKDGKYEAEHCRYGSSRFEILTIEEIADFLRNFLDLGFTYVRKPKW